MHDKKILVVIPARGGSKQIQKKNIYKIAGKPLIFYTIQLALKLKSYFYKIIVSTDDKEIADLSSSYGVEVPFLRPSEISTDFTPMLPVLQHSVNFIENKNNVILDWILLLQPTDPLREENDIVEALKIGNSTEKCDSVISVERVFSHHPVLMKKIKNNKIVPFFVEEKEGTPRQKYEPPAFMRNGSIYLSKRNTIVNKNSIWGEHSVPMIMEEGSRISIDNMNDLRLVETILKKKNKA